MELVVGRNDQPVAFVERRRTGEQRRGVPVGTEPEVDEAERAVIPEELVVRVGGPLDRVAGAPHGVDRARAHLVDESVPGYALVRLGVVDRHPPLVPEEYVDLAPIDVGARQQLVAFARGRPARERERRRRLLGDERRERAGHVVDHA